MPKQSSVNLSLAVSIIELASSLPRHSSTKTAGHHHPLQPSLLAPPHLLQQVLACWLSIAGTTNLPFQDRVVPCAERDRGECGGYFSKQPHNEALQPVSWDGRQ